MHWRRAQLLVATALTVGLAACGSGAAAPSGPVAIESGQLTPAELPSHQALHRLARAAVTETTVPLAQEDPTTAFFTAIGSFQSCLTALGIKFLGAPNPGNPSSAANNPNYLKGLEVCAAQSNIVQALKNEQASQATLTQAQIATQNKAYLKWRTCMIKRGWTIPEPTPDSQGRLFSFGAGGGAPRLTPPPGASLLNSPDLRQCASQAGASGGKR